MQRWTGEIAALQEGEALDLRPADYFYHLLALDPFKSAVRNANTARNLAIFSQLLNVFQSYYHYTVVTYKNREFLRLHFFNSFLRLLYDGGINEYEDPDQPFPKGHVQVMTIHQAKGLEFPVVAIGSLSTQLSSPKQIDRNLGPFYHRPPFEPENRITQFDRMRLHYVAFSRPEQVLVLTAHESPKDHFAPIWQGLPQWPYVQKELLSAQRFEVRERMPVKKTYSFTGDLKIYETCPRQYQFFREYDFTPSRSAVIFFGLLVHQTIEEIHRIALDGKLDAVDEPRIRDLFDRTFRFLVASDVRPIGDKAREAALRQVLNYFHQNRDEMHRVIQTEVDVSLEKERLHPCRQGGSAARRRRQAGAFGLQDVAAPEGQPRADLRVRAPAVHLRPYSGAAPRPARGPASALLDLGAAQAGCPHGPPLRPEASGAGGLPLRRDGAPHPVARMFAVTTPPEAAICKECDLKMLCHAEGIITGEARG